MTTRIALTCLLVIGCGSKQAPAPLPTAAITPEPAPAPPAAPTAGTPEPTAAKPAYCLVQRKLDGNKVASIASTDKTATLCTELEGVQKCGALDLARGTWSPAPLVPVEDPPFTYGGADHWGELCHGTKCVKLQLPAVKSSGDDYTVDRSANGTYVAHSSATPTKYFIVDPETGTLKKTVTIKGECGGGPQFLGDTLYLRCAGEDRALYTLDGKRVGVIEDAGRTPPVSLRDDVFVLEMRGGYAEVNVKTGAMKMHAIDFSDATEEDYSAMTGDSNEHPRFAVLPNGTLIYVYAGIRLIAPTTGVVERTYHQQACPRDENW